MKTHKKGDPNDRGARIKGLNEYPPNELKEKCWSEMLRFDKAARFGWRRAVDDGPVSTTTLEQKSSDPLNTLRWAIHFHNIFQGQF
ncbi:hypothetical protein CDAR_482281 [Caerostris darwini]|uniref:Uncharacterized protein n=1 Tax=Caerostris darwini TaxID=1538125 RepID=A0AAV4TIZ1_9ARAC|nr:hypothetical protein CDAR_482281 [Caerostris darwini]